MPCVMQECTQPVLPTQHDDSDESVSDVEQFSAKEKERLARLRRAIARGERGEAFPVDKRQDFIRWLIQQGRLSES